MALWGTTTLSGTQAQKRADARKPVKHSAVLHYKGTQIPVVLHDMSRGGACIGFSPGRVATVIDGPATLEVRGSLRLPVTVRWRKNTVFGASFDVPPERRAVFQQQIDRIIARAGR